jgi:hypothetical protein
MTDQTPPGGGPTTSPCPWCSAPVTPEAATCASCGAILISDDQPDLPGVTAVDPQSFSQAKQAAPSRNRLLSWISGDYPADEATSPADAHAISPPDPAVQREIRRLELEAEVANLQAEADAILSEAAAEGRVIDVPDELQTLAAAGGVEEALDAAEAEDQAASPEAAPPGDTNPA